MSTSGFSTSLFLANDAATTSLGASLAPALERGDTVLLVGEIGSGKTHLARALIQACLQQPEDVPSPTYTLVQTYRTAKFDIWHADLYRLSDPTELEELGLLEAFDNAVVLIEWPDRLGNLAPADALWVHMTQEGEGRRVELTSSAARWAKIEGCFGNV